MVLYRFRVFRKWVSTFTIKIPFPGGKVEFAAFDKILAEMDSVKLVTSFDSVLTEFKHGKRILVIDDNAEMCDFIESILSEQYDVIKEVDSTGTFNNILTYMPDLIISDVMMPGINGFELVKQVRNDVRFSHIPIILLTAKVTTSDHITGYETGADDYIYKPFDGEILKPELKTLLLKKKHQKALYWY